MSLPVNGTLHNMTATRRVRWVSTADLSSVLQVKRSMAIVTVGYLAGLAYAAYSEHYVRHWGGWVPARMGSMEPLEEQLQRQLASVKH